MAKLAIISSYDENCGNASYTHVLKNAFSKVIDTDVISLDLLKTQRHGSYFGRAADKHIRNIAEKLRSYDFVNIQFEAGLYGSSIESIRRHVFWLIDAAPNVILTMHRVDPRTRNNWQLFKARLPYIKNKISKEMLNQETYARLYHDIIEKCESVSARKNVWIAVHTQREKKIIHDVYGFANCFDYPLAFLTNSERQEVKKAASRDVFLRKHHFPADAKVIGGFGFIGAYKGFDTLVHTLDLLPQDYILAIFGSQHPQSIEANKRIDDNLNELLKLIHHLDEVAENRLAKKVLTNKESRKSRPSSRSVINSEDADVRNVVDVAPARKSFMSRVRFVGSLPDPAFIEALRLCDAVVLPYLEVGQSMSGVIALALEAGSRMFCSNNLSFFEAHRYYGDVYETFDIGNYSELAQKIQLSDTCFDARREAAFARFNIEDSVRIHMTKFENAGTANGTS